ncbi:MAG: winged helix-turn-helix transcriptional regulator [Patescibacteria group bacterium]
MKNVIILIIAVLVGIAIGIYFGRKKGIGNINQERADLKNERKNKILEMLKTSARVSNNDVQKLLNVSDATATRYLEELETEGKVRQIGEKGRFVEYELKG